MKPPPFTYHAPATLDEACGLLSTLDNAKLLAGGQSLMAMLNSRFIFPDHLVDINKLPGLDGIAVRDGWLAVGALARQRAMEVNGEIARVAPIFAEALAVVGHRQTRNRGTLGGSLCHLDPAGELPLLALLHDATVRTVASGGRARAIAAGDFVAGFMMPGIAEDEIVVGVDVPLWPPGHGHAFVERARRRGDFAIASAACLLQTDGAGRIERIALGIGGIGAVPMRVPAAEADLLGSVADAVAVERAAGRVAGLDAVSDFHGSSAYRRSIAAALLRIAVTARLCAIGATMMQVAMTVNGSACTAAVEDRTTLADCLRHGFGLTGTHLGCEHGVCGACTVLVDGVSVRSCLMLAVQASGSRVRTIEGLGDADGRLHPLQEAFHRHHGLQCGYCTPGMLMTLMEFLAEVPDPTEAQVRDAISGNLCRCTGYQGIIAAALAAAAVMRGAG